MEKEYKYKKVYFVGFQYNNGGISGSTTLEWVSEESINGYKNLLEDLSNELAGIMKIPRKKILINSITLLYQEELQKFLETEQNLNKNLKELKIEEK